MSEQKLDMPASPWERKRWVANPKPLVELIGNSALPCEPSPLQLGEVFALFNVQI
jgi:hypothetical protein